jgi:hypothetical protein
VACRLAFLYNPSPHWTGKTKLFVAKCTCALLKIPFPFKYLLALGRAYIFKGFSTIYNEKRTLMLTIIRRDIAGADSEVLKILQWAMFLTCKLHR